LKYLLDTNVCVQHLRGRGGITVALEQQPESDVAISALTVFELLYGAHKTRHPVAAVAAVTELMTRFESLPFNDAAADASARVRVALERSGQAIGPTDLLIAGVAISRGLTLVTHNTREFNRIAGLSVQDWQTG
jgi:tRNA(fMet)-specific endonuclease VapC